MISSLPRPVEIEHTVMIVTCRVGAVLIVRPDDFFFFLYKKEKKEQLTTVKVVISA